METQKPISVHVKTDPVTYRRFKMLCALHEYTIAENLGHLIEDYVALYERELPPIDEKEDSAEGEDKPTETKPQKENEDNDNEKNRHEKDDTEKDNSASDENNRGETEGDRSGSDGAQKSGTETASEGATVDRE